MERNKIMDLTKEERKKKLKELKDRGIFMNLKEVFAYAPYSEFSQNVFKIGLMPYSLVEETDDFKCFVFFFEFEPSTESEPMSKEELKEYGIAKKFFGKTDKEKEEDACRERDE